MDLNQETEVETLSRYINSTEFEIDIEQCFGKSAEQSEENADIADSELYIQHLDRNT